MASRLRATLAASVSRCSIRICRPLRVAVSTVNRPATNANRYVGSGWVSANRMRLRPVGRWRPSDSRAVGNRLPVGRDVERERVARLQVRLIETRETPAGRGPGRTACRGTRRSRLSASSPADELDGQLVRTACVNSGGMTMCRSRVNGCRRRSAT